MSLKRAVPFLRSIVKTNASSGNPPQYTFHDGFCYAQNPAVLAAYPTPHILGTFGLAAEDLESALSRMPDEPVISAGDEAMILRSGRLRSTIKVFEALVPHYSVGAQDESWIAVPSGLTAAVRKAALFTSSRGTWQTSVRLMSDSVSSINDRSAIQIEVDLSELEETVCLTDTTVKYLESQDDPDLYQLLPGALVLLWSQTGAWARCQLSMYPWPSDVLDKVMAAAGADEPPVQLTQEWKDALADIVALSDGHVEVTPDGLRGVSSHSVHEVPFATGAQKTSRWSISVVKQLVAAAERWDPDASGPALFVGPGCRGVMARQK